MVVLLFHFRLIRRRVYERVGGLDPCFERPQDYDLCLKLSEITEIYHLPQPLYFYRTHTQSVSQQNRIEQIQWAKCAIAFWVSAAILIPGSFKLY